MHVEEMSDNTSNSYVATSIATLKNALNGVNEFKNNIHRGTVSLTHEIRVRLVTWVDNLKGKSNNPDQYFPRENFQLLYYIDKKNPKLLLEIAKIGASLRDAETDAERLKLNEKLQLVFNKFAKLP